MDTNNTYRILGIDPGTNTLGAAIVDVDLLSAKVRVSMARTFVGTAMSSEYSTHSDVHGDRASRLHAHEENLTSVMYDWRPHRVICESAFMGKFAQSYMALVECIGAIQRAVYRYNPFLPLEVIDPTSVKKMAGMTGRLRGKEPVREALAELPYLEYGQGVRLALLDEHSVDAIAIAHTVALSVRQWVHDDPMAMRQKGRTP